MKKWITSMLITVLVMTLLGGGAFATETETPTTALSPTTGLPTDAPYRPIMVLINNSEASRPAWGLASADIVYESVNWGPNHTRYLAIFNDEYPEMAGPIHDMRIHHAQWRQEWDCPLVFWGEFPNETTVYDFFKENNVREQFLFDGRLGTDSIVLGLNSERDFPFNAVVNLRELVENYWPADETTGEPYAPRRPQLTFSDTPSTGDETAAEICYTYEEEVIGVTSRIFQSTYHPSYIFNPEERVYERWYNGEPDTDLLTGERVVASNVITQYCALSYYNDNSSRPKLETTGSGRIDAFIDGQHIQGTWVREDMDSQTQYFNTNGDPLVLLPGKTFVQVLSPRMTVEFIDDAGQTHICTADI